MESLLEVDGIGPKKVSFFHKLGIDTVDDLISYYPKRYQVLKRSDMRYVQNGEKIVLDGVLEACPIIMQTSSRLKMIGFRMVNSSNIYNVRVYNQVYLCKELKSGMSIIVFGKFDKFRNMIIASEVRIGKLSNNVEIEPVYGTTEGLNRKLIGKIIEKVLLDNRLNVIDYIPSYFISKYHFPDKLWSISQIHYPVDVISFKRAKQRMKYEEFFLYLLKIGYMKRLRQKDDKRNLKKFDVNKVDDFIKNLSFSLTVDQIKVLDDIKKDFLSLKNMNRLVQGDVGSGKTIVAFLACYMNYLAGYQTALMVPTEILANQHYEDAVSLFKEIDMEIVLLTSSISKRERNSILKRIKNGDVHFIIGTQSLIQEDVIYSNLGLIITDEQHRFGVDQRQKLRNKGGGADVLSMSATPIPRTYALTIYGDMDVSNIRTKPIGRKEVITYYKSNDDILEVLNMMKKEIDLGHQIYVIAPSIEKDNSYELETVCRLKEKMELALGKICKVGAVHGKLDNLEKKRIMEQFENGSIQILISTTVIEVGVNVPSASMIVIFQANLFGLSTLHQLRGRVGRGNIQSYCVLISKQKCERLEMLVQTNDGFLVSEYDFKNRGEGDLFGVRQSGEALFKLADIKKDFDLLLRVRNDVDEFFDKFYWQDSYKFLRDYLNDLQKLD